MISRTTQNALENASWIREMFEKGNLLKKQKGVEAVFDFSLGNPILEPPSQLINSWIDHLRSSAVGKHRYMSNNGYLSTREYIASQLQDEIGVPFTADEIVMSVGAAGGLNCVFGALLNSDEEIITVAPFFPEYKFYAENVNAKLIVVPTKENFQLDIPAIEKAITEKTRIILINSPNNPTGAVYSQETIKDLVHLLTIKNKQLKYPLILLSDEPYKNIIFDGKKNCQIFTEYEHAISVNSFSKELGLAGERIGYISFHPQLREKKKIIDGVIFKTRTLGFVNAPASLQAILPSSKNIQVDISYYEKNRNFFFNELINIGYKIVKPQGAFYFFPQALEEDDKNFVERASQYGILLVPGVGFGKAGYFRLSYCCKRDILERSLPFFYNLYRSYI